jgi:putative chitinase
MEVSRFSKPAHDGATPACRQGGFSAKLGMGIGGRAAQTFVSGRHIAAPHAEMERSMIDIASLVAAGIGPTQARAFEAPLNAACERFQIDNPRRQAAFIAQCAHESGLFVRLEEGLFYRTAERICIVYRKQVPTIAAALPLVANPRGLANRVYANRNGNGNEASGDGWRYRGRGLIQLTGRANYASAGTKVARPYVEQPDLVMRPEDACLTAGAYWDMNRLNALADRGDIDAITKAVNGPGMVGAAERRALFDACLMAFG